MQYFPRILRRLWCPHRWNLLAIGWDVEIWRCSECERIRWIEDDEQDLPNEEGSVVPQASDLAS